MTMLGIIIAVAMITAVSAVSYSIMDYMARSALEDNGYFHLKFANFAYEDRTMPCGIMIRVIKDYDLYRFSHRFVNNIPFTKEEIGISITGLLFLSIDKKLVCFSAIVPLKG